MLELCEENFLVETRGSIELAGVREHIPMRRGCKPALHVVPLPYSFQRAGTDPSMIVMSKNSPDTTSR